MIRKVPEALSQRPSETGLCPSCRYAELKTTTRSVFIFCRRSETDQRWTKYPRLPVVDCLGYERISSPGEAGDGGHRRR